jgi:hypothetical protein
MMQATSIGESRMTQLWKKRTRTLAAALGLAMLGALGLAVVLSTAQDPSGAQAAAGASAVTGLAFVAAVAVLVVDSLCADLKPRS